MLQKRNLISSVLNILISIEVEFEGKIKFQLFELIKNFAIAYLLQIGIPPSRRHDTTNTFRHRRNFELSVCTHAQASAVYRTRNKLHFQ